MGEQHDDDDIETNRRSSVLCRRCSFLSSFLSISWLSRVWKSKNSYLLVIKVDN